MREKLLQNLANWHAFHPWRMFGIALLITLVMFGLAGQLSLTMRTSDLLPEGDPKVVQFNKIVDEFATATSLVVVVQGEENRIKKFADDLAPRILTLKDTSNNHGHKKEIDNLQKKIGQLKKKNGKLIEITELEKELENLENRINMKLFQRVDYKTETEFLRNHMLMLVKTEDLKDTKDLFTDPNLSGLITNINNSMEKEYVGKEESISTREKEDGAVGFLDGIENLVLKLQKTAKGEVLEEREVRNAADKFLLGEPYFLSYDKTALIMDAIPNFTLMDRDLLMIADEMVQSIVDKLLKDYPDVTAGLSGGIAREHDEQVYSQQSLGYSTLIAFGAILLLLIISFKMWVAPVLAMVNLFVGLIWALGAAFIAVGQLNMMTSMLAVVVLGLGIDFSIHLISGFTEWRAAGDSIASSMEKTFLKSGKGIITGALTTACAFLALLISQTRGMKEMGIVIGVGLLSIMLTTLLFLPVLLVFRERRIDKKREKKGIQKIVQRDISFRKLGSIGNWLSQHYVFTILVSIVVSGLLIWSALQITYDQNYMNMEPKGLTSIALTDTIMQKFDLSMEYALCLADDVEESRELSEAYRDLSVVAMTNDISLYLPSKEQHKKRIPLVTEVRNKMRSSSIKKNIIQSDINILNREINRLEMNIMEIQDMAFIGGQDKVDNKCKAIVGDPEIPDSQNILQELQEYLRSNKYKAARNLSKFQRMFAPYFKQNVIKMCSTNPIHMEDLPVSILDRYSNRARDQFLISIYPAGNLWYDATALNRFVDEVERISEKTTGAPPLGVALLKIFARDGRNAIILTLIIVFILLCIDFFNPKYALIAMIPLALGVFWMVGLMRLVGIQLNFMNLMALPLIIGIGIDDGVHIMHRWQHEGKGKIITVFSSTGKAIMLTSLTTMLAFGSMTFSVFPAWAWFGEALFIGVGACFLTSVIILPGILGLIEKGSRKIQK
jgi:predicted RND superfamily exporter protein